MRMACIALCLAATASAYNAPADTAGPLTVTIEGPETLLQTGVAVPVAVKLQNKGAAAVSGTVRLKVVDTFQAAPANAPFSVAAGATASLSFTVTAADGTYNAYYPVHAFAEFSSGAKRWWRTRS